MSLYHIFTLAVFLLWIGSVPADRNALRVVVAATVASWLVVDLWTVNVTGHWKLVIPGLVETATIAALLTWARNRTGYSQAVALCVAWIAHLLCYLDLRLGTDMVYLRYEAVLGAVSVAQLALCHETYLHHFRRMGRWWTNRGSDRAGPVLGPSMSAPLLHHPGASGAEPLPPCKNFRTT